MTAKIFSPELLHKMDAYPTILSVGQIIFTTIRYAALPEQEASAATADVCRKHRISDAALYKRKAKFGGLDLSDARRRKALEYGNSEPEAR